MSYKAEYLWIDGQKPTAKMRSKGKVVADGYEPPRTEVQRQRQIPEPMGQFR